MTCMKVLKMQVAFSVSSFIVAGRLYNVECVAITEHEQIQSYKNDQYSADDQLNQKQLLQFSVCLSQFSRQFSCDFVILTDRHMVR